MKQKAVTALNTPRTTLPPFAATVEAWLVERLAVRELAARVSGISLERHAEILESDPARWHWMHLLDRIADPGDVLAPLRTLIEALATKPNASTFFSYSSLNRLCFTASSHYPWVDDGLPVLVRVEEGRYLVGNTHCDLKSAVELVEATLAASPVRPFFGSAPHYELPLLSEKLARQGSTLRPRLEQHGAWYELVVADAAGAKRCTVSARQISFFEGQRRLVAAWPGLDDVARAIRRYCEEQEPLDEVISDGKAKVVSLSGAAL